MRWGLLLLVLAACESRYGAYLVVTSDVEIDRAELYFGIAIDSSGSGSGDQFATPALGTQAGKVFDRMYDPTDVVTFAAAKQRTFYLPPDPRNEQLGAYVAAVGLAGGKPVGIAEFFDFEVPSDEVHEYLLPLVPWEQQTADRWGSEPGCLAWKRTRDGGPAIAAVIHADDRDCDAQAQSADCNDLCSDCGAERSFCESTTFCATGCQQGALCAPAMCLPAAACSTTCAAKPYADRIMCGMVSTFSHVEFYVDRSDTRRLCANEIHVALQQPCTAPAIEAQDLEGNPSFMYSIEPDTALPNSCLIKIAQASTAMFGTTEGHHLLISFASTQVGPRQSMIVGINASFNALGCGNGVLVTSTYPTKPINDCKP